jgi:hypothetical protein
LPDSDHVSELSKYAESEYQPYEASCNEGGNYQHAYTDLRQCYAHPECHRCSIFQGEQKSQQDQTYKYEEGNKPEKPFHVIILLAEDSLIIYERSAVTLEIFINKKKRQPLLTEAAVLT